MKAKFLAIVATAALTAFAAVAAAAQQTPTYNPDQSAHRVTTRGAVAEQDRITREVRHQLAMLPYYSVFDDLAYQVNGNTVTLLGAVANPVVKSDAEHAVKHIEGVESVQNNIQVLPVSPMDDQIRRAEFRAIYGTPGMEKYAWYAVQGIHIIVDHGHVTLMGVVDNEGDKNIAGIKAKGVANVFSVQNDLQVAGNGEQARK